MATHLPSAASFRSAETFGPLAGYDELERTLGPAHPMNCTCDETLFYYDGPQCWIGRVAGDHRPRLNVVVDQGSRGDAPRTVFTSRYHQFTFSDERVLRSTLCEGMAPTRRTYDLAEEIVEWEVESAHVDDPEPRSICRTRMVEPEDVADDIMENNLPDGIPIGTREERA